MKRILLYKNGATDAALVCSIGDYEDWFTKLLGSQVQLEVHCAFEKPRCELAGYDGLILSGSAQSLVDPVPWMDEAATWVETAGRAGVPTLGICFGHQLVAYAFGGKIRRNPHGWEIGTHAISLGERAQQDPLFAGFPETIHVNQSHRDEVAELGEAEWLVRGDHTEIQALAVADCVRSVQFHPEINGHVIGHLIRYRRQILEADAQERGRDPAAVDALLDTVSDTPWGEKVLSNFVSHFVRFA